MKTQLSKPSRSKASYTEEYKQQALELWRASGRSAAKVATELGLRPPLLYRWARIERPSANSSPPGPKHGRTIEELEAENRRLRGERQTSGAARSAKNRWASSPKCRREVCPIEQMSGHYKVAWLCESPPGLAQRLLRLGGAARQPGPRQLENMQLRKKIRQEFARSRQT
ncbi:MAG: transposase [Pyrinomonadaceae bacterium]|nr:transposase [Pyrinomonadaceae bacterium]